MRPEDQQGSKRIVLWETYDRGKPRVRILARGLRENGVELLECHIDVWTGIEDKSQLRGVLSRARILGKWICAYPRLLYRYLRLPRHDVVIVPYLGHFDVLVLWPWARMRGARLVWDAFLSLYNTVVEDRRLVAVSSPISVCLKLWERMACRAVDLIVLDTKAHARYFAERFGIPERKLVDVFVGAEPEHFTLSDELVPRSESPMVLFYGQFIPLHGIETIIHAARLSTDEDIHWVLIGTGQEAGRVQGLLGEVPLRNVTWIPWVPYADLHTWIRKAHVCLGIFGDTDKAARVIPNKVFQVLMAGKPLITRDSPAIRELLTPALNGVYLVPPADPAKLVSAVQAALKNASDGVFHESVRDRITPQAVGRTLIAAINHL